MPAAATTTAAGLEPAVSPHGEGHGRRLTAAFDALEAFPALAESRDRVLRVVREDRTSVGEVVAAVESDVALVITVLRIANRNAQRKKGKVAGIPEAIEILSPEGVETVAARATTFDFFERTPGWDLMPERLHKERLELGVDHALVGGVLARRWSLPNRLAMAIERHHASDAEEEAALVRLADMLAHYGHAQPVNPKELLQAARACGLTTEQLRSVMYELPQGNGTAK